eukprot:4998000-Prymnesium_polylepis.1
MRIDEVDEVVLVGGSTRMAHVRRMLRDHFDKEPNCDVSPEEAVAHGTAIQVGCRRPFGRRWPLTPSLPHTLSPSHPLSPSPSCFTRLPPNRLTP